MTIVSIKGQIVLPKKIVDTLNLKEGMDVNFQLSENNSACTIIFNEPSGNDYQSKILARNQVTIPKVIRDKMKIEPNDSIEFSILENKLELKLKNKSWVNKAIGIYEANYDFLGVIDLGKFERPHYIGEKDECRFCGRKKGEVKFKKIAHAVPELLGNKVLFSNDECDECNLLFAKWESELGNYLHFWRSATMQAGKRGVPKFKDSLFQMGESNDGSLLIKDTTINKHLSFDNQNKTVTIEGVQKPYIPSGVYKSFVKMALSLIPKVQLKNFEETIEWLLDDKSVIKTQSKLILIEQFVPGPNPYPNIQILAFSRKSDSLKNTPYYIFLLCYSNYVFQIYVPFCKLDKDLLLENMGYTVFPSNYALVLPEGTIKPFFKDLSSDEKTKGEPIELEFTYDEKIEISPEYYKNLNVDFK